MRPEREVRPDFQLLDAEAEDAALTLLDDRLSWATPFMEKGFEKQKWEKGEQEVSAQSRWHHADLKEGDAG